MIEKVFLATEFSILKQVSNQDIILITRQLLLSSKYHYEMTPT